MEKSDDGVVGNDVCGRVFECRADIRIGQVWAKI